MHCTVGTFVCDVHTYVRRYVCPHVFPYECTLVYPRVSPIDESHVQLGVLVNVRTQVHTYVCNIK